MNRGGLTADTDLIVGTKVDAQLSKSSPKEIESRRSEVSNMVAAVL